MTAPVLSTSTAAASLVAVRTLVWIMSGSMVPLLEATRRPRALIRPTLTSGVAGRPEMQSMATAGSPNWMSFSSASTAACI